VLLLDDRTRFVIDVFARQSPISLTADRPFAGPRVPVAFPAGIPAHIRF
jgi:hypothetical protein